MDLYIHFVIILRTVSVISGSFVKTSEALKYYVLEHKIAILFLISLIHQAHHEFISSRRTMDSTSFMSTCEFTF